MSAIGNNFSQPFLQNLCKGVENLKDKTGILTFDKSDAGTQGLSEGVSYHKASEKTDTAALDVGTANFRSRVAHALVDELDAAIANAGLDGKDGAVRTFRDKFISDNIGMLIFSNGKDVTKDALSVGDFENMIADIKSKMDAGIKSKMDAGIKGVTAETIARQTQAKLKGVNEKRADGGPLRETLLSDLDISSKRIIVEESKLNEMADEAEEFKKFFEDYDVGKGGDKNVRLTNFFQQLRGLCKKTLGSAVRDKDMDALDKYKGRIGARAAQHDPGVDGGEKLKPYDDEAEILNDFITWAASDERDDPGEDLAALKEILLDCQEIMAQKIEVPTGEKNAADEL